MLRIRDNIYIFAKVNPNQLFGMLIYENNTLIWSNL